MRRALRVLLRWPLRAWLYRRCLARIRFLEHTLGIEAHPGQAFVFKSATKTEWLEDGIGPGSWANYLYGQQEAVQQVFQMTNRVQTLAAMNLLGSGAAARACADSAEKPT